MYRKIVIAGATAAVIIGAGTAALAESGSTSSPSATTAGQAQSPSQSGTKTGSGKRVKLGAALRRSVHAQVVTRGKDGTFVTHDEIRGTVDTVSSTSITITAADGTKQTYMVGSSTKVRLRSNGKGAASTIGAVKPGDAAIALGTGTPTPTATVIVAVAR